MTLIEKMRALEAARTPGEWYLYGATGGICDGRLREIIAPDSERAIIAELKDLAYITAMSVLIPALLALCEKQHEALKVAAGLLDRNSVTVMPLDEALALYNAEIEP